MMSDVVRLAVTLFNMVMLCVSISAVIVVYRQQRKWEDNFVHWNSRYKTPAKRSPKLKAPKP